MDVITISSDSSGPPSPCISENIDDANLYNAFTKHASSTSHITVHNEKLVHKFSDSEESDSGGEMKFQKYEYLKEAFSSQMNEYHTDLDTEPRKTTFHLNIKETTSATSMSVSLPKDIKRKKNETKAIEKKQEKALKKAALQAQRAKRPGECLKNVTVIVDQQLLAEEFSDVLLCSLQAAELQYDIIEQLVPKTVSWTRTIYNFHCDENMQVASSKMAEQEKHVLTIMHWSEVFDLIQSEELRNHVQKICSLFDSPIVTLVIYKLSEYIKSQKNKQNKNISNKRKKSYNISKHDFEKIFTELQLFEGCSYRCVESAEDLGTLVSQFTKAIAEKTFKLEKSSRQQENLDWYAAGSSKNTVRIDKNGFGCSQLWKQQICQFNNVGIDVAEAITSVYSSPKSLIEAYGACKTQREGEQLLQDLPVRRGAGPLASVRRIGPELSRKIYLFFTAVDGEISLS